MQIFAHYHLLNSPSTRVNYSIQVTTHAQKDVPSNNTYNIDSYPISSYRLNFHVRTFVRFLSGLKRIFSREVCGDQRSQTQSGGTRTAALCRPTVVPRPSSAEVVSLSSVRDRVRLSGTGEGSFGEPAHRRGGESYPAHYVPCGQLFGLRTMGRLGLKVFRGIRPMKDSCSIPTRTALLSTLVRLTSRYNRSTVTKTPAYTCSAPTALRRPVTAGHMSPPTEHLHCSFGRTWHQSQAPEH